MTMIRLKDAGHREQEFAQQLVREGKAPVDYATFLDYGVYDPSKDEVGITVKAVFLSYKVERA